MKTLNIIETAYRATLEEQDDPVVWIIHAMKGAGAEQSVLLRANAVNYAVKTQGAPPLAFGTRAQKHGPRLADAIGALPGKGVPVYLLSDDLADRGVEIGEILPNLLLIGRAELPQLLDRYDRVWHW
ncbi:MAG: DsrE family protein [Proteobacteria bacterium]|nr:DsrE family protein [Pseudomonadota bacterium]